VLDQADLVEDLDFRMFLDHRAHAASSSRIVGRRRMLFDLERFISKLKERDRTWHVAAQASPRPWPSKPIVPATQAVLRPR
jgi:hypothetical protein